MKKELLKDISKANKVDFLNKLQSGNFNLVKPFEPVQGLTFNLQTSGLYKCKQTGKVMSKDEIFSLPGYKIKLEIVSNRLQVSGDEPVSGYVLIPFGTDEYLTSILVSKTDIHLAYDETDQAAPFKSDKEKYSFADLMRMNGESPEVNFLMDEETKNAYSKCLEKWC